MSTFRRFFLRILVFFRAGRADADAMREIQSHLRLLEEDFVARGMSAGDARAAARRAFGGQVEQTRLRHRDARSFRWLDEGWLDAKLGARMLVRFPGLTLVGGIGIAVAIAISTTSFAFFYSYLYSTLPLEDGERVVALENWDVEANNEERQALHDFATWRSEMTTMEEIAAFRTVNRNLIVPGGAVEPVRLAEITASAFRVARVAPALGRTLLDEDERPNAPPVVVIGHDVWQSRFSSDPAIVGREIRLGHTVHDIIGVMPEGFRFPVSHSYWVPMRLDPAHFERGQGPAIFIFGRLAPGATVEQAQAELATLGQRAAAAFPKTHARLRPQVLAYALPILDIQDASLWQVTLMQFTVSIILVVVAVNVGILVYARTATRQGELAVRTALGASRQRIITQLFIEALVLCATAAAVSLGLSHLGIRQAHTIMQLEGALPYWIRPGIPAAAFLYVVALAVFAALVAGVLPALHATGRHVHTTLRNLGGSSEPRFGRTGTVLIVSQVALAVALLPLVVAMAWDEIKYTTTKPAFNLEHFLAAGLTMDPEPPPGYSPEGYEKELASRLRRVEAQLVARLESESWVSDVTRAARPPGAESAWRIELEGTTPAGHPAVHEVDINVVDVDFFQTFGASVLTGRGFSSADTPASIVVNRAFVRKVLGDGEALGRRLKFVDGERGDGPDTRATYEIVGVVADLHANTIDPEIVRPVLYRPFEPGRMTMVSVVVRVSGGAPTSYVGRLREITASIDPTVRMSAYPLVTLYRQESVALRLVAGAMTLVVVTVLLLSAAGIYALMSFAVSQRRKEIGIRAALGADARQLLWSVFGRSAWQLSLGLVLGLAVAAGLDLASDGSLIGSSRVLLLPAMSALMLIVGLLASLGPARRGLRIQPTEALRED